MKIGTTKNRKCSYPNCDRKHHCKEYCKPHYRRFKNGKQMDGPFKKGNGEGYLDSHGYVYLNIDGKNYMQHRVIYEQHIGRKLLSTENIHHKNGNRSDNRIENLELWSIKQPCGQKIEDKIKWALEILEQYNFKEVDDVHYW
jgi:hypothetical protein